MVGFVATGDGEWGAERHCGKIEVEGGVSVRALPEECGRVLGRWIHVEILVKAGLLIAGILDVTSSRFFDCTAPPRRGSASATLVAKLGLRSSGMMRGTACDQCGMDGCGRCMGRGSAAKGADSVFGRRCCFRAQLVKLQSRAG